MIFAFISCVYFYIINIATAFGILSKNFLAIFSRVLKQTPCSYKRVISNNMVFSINTHSWYFNVLDEIFRILFPAATWKKEFSQSVRMYSFNIYSSIDEVP